MLTYDYDLSAGKHHLQRFIYTEQYTDLQRMSNQR